MEWRTRCLFLMNDTYMFFSLVYIFHLIFTTDSETKAHKDKVWIFLSWFHDLCKLVLFIRFLFHFFVQMVSDIILNLCVYKIWKSVMFECFCVCYFMIYCSTTRPQDLTLNMVFTINCLCVDLDSCVCIIT